MQLIDKFNKGFRFLLCLIDAYSKYACDVLSKEKNILQLLMLSKKAILIANQTKYGWLKGQNFTIDQ